MRRWMNGAAVLALAMCLPLSSMAEGAKRFDGEIVCTAPVSVRAPFGGQVEDYARRAGACVEEGETVLGLSVTRVYAPFDGVVTGVNVQAGDSAEQVLSRYGALCYLEDEGRFTVSATTSGAYNQEENKIVYAGEKVYLKNPNATTRIGEGVITGVTGSAYKVEVTDAGTLHLGDEVNIFRDKSCASETRIGRGRVARADAHAVSAAGSILRVYVQQGQRVARGDVLFETVEGELDGRIAPDSAIAAPCTGTLAQVRVDAGARVQKDDVLFVVHPRSALEAKITVSEDDIAGFTVGERVQVEIDALEDAPVAGTVVSVAGIPEEGGRGYAVYVAFPLPGGAREGMRVQVGTE